VSYPATLPLTGKESDKKKATPKKTHAAIALSHLGGLKGGKARAKHLPAKRRTEIARTTAKARWKLSQLSEEPRESDESGLV